MHADDDASPFPPADSPLRPLVGCAVVLDTAGSILYIGTLEEISPHGCWLGDADVHDCREGHAGKELYLCEARTHGVRPNRRRVFVFRETIISASLLEDVVVEG